MTIFICGDSTAASYPPEKAPLTGWGQVLGEFLPGTPIVNHAMAGRSSKSFLAEGRLLPVEQALRPGDLLLIQFTHNDRNPLPERHTDPRTTFPECLRVYLAAARRCGAIPVLMTPIPLRQWEAGCLADTHGDYPQAIRDLAREEAIPLLEITRPAMQRLADMGPEAAKALYLHLQPGVFPAWPQGAADDVHTNLAGARFYARLAAEQLQTLGLAGLPAESDRKDNHHDHHLLGR